MKTTSRILMLGKTHFHLCLGALLLAGCETVHQPNRANSDKLANEGSLMFVRPDRYSIIGTRSIRDYVEITYEKPAHNDAGLMMVQVGLRNRGGQKWYDVRGPNFPLSIKTSFYTAEVQGKGPGGPPVYETNWQPLTLLRGDTAHYEATCPVKAARFYQVTVSEFIKQ